MKGHRSTRPPFVRLGGAVLIGLTAFLSSCTTNPQVEFGPSTAQPTVTVTTTITVTATNPSPTPSTPLPGTSPSSTPTAATFNRTLADQQYANVIASISIIDGQFASAGAPSLRLEVLAKTFGTLFTLGVPPGLDGPSYLSRLRTLEMFAQAAAQESMTDRQRAAERYQVIRRETGLLLTQVNGVLGTAYTLPTTPQTTSASTPPTTLTTPPPR